MNSRTGHRTSRTFALAFVSLVYTVSVPNDAALARDDIPPEVAARVNPEQLDESEVRYFTRQFKGKCTRCHGKHGRGGGEHARAQNFPPANFTDVPYMQSRTDGQLFYQILMGGGKRCAMPAFGPESDHAWTEEKIWHMVAFVRRFSMAAPTPP